MNLLVKFPTRGRKIRFVDVMARVLNNTVDFDKTKFLLTLDSDDPEMDEDFVKNRIAFYKRVYGDELEIDYFYGTSKNKIDAVNRDVDRYTKPWDILLLLSDDMDCEKYGYDRIIRMDMEGVAPDLDCVLYYPDGFTDLNTMPIIGRKYYERFNYIYYPGYESFFCDNEFMETSILARKHFQSKLMLFRHNHPIWTGKGWDPTYEKNNTTWEQDKKLFEERREAKRRLIQVTNETKYTDGNARI